MWQSGYFVAGEPLTSFAFKFDVNSAAGFGPSVICELADTRLVAKVDLGFTVTRMTCSPDVELNKL
jgi:hypothetical protein